jgi:hypothetical protein
MVDFSLRLPRSQNIVWIPQEIVNAFGRNLTISPNSVAAALYPEGADLDDVARSLSIIVQDLELRAARKKRP